MDAKLITMVVLLVIVIICFGVTTSYTFLGIGQIDDADRYMKFGYPLSAGIFALIAAISIPIAFKENDLTLALAVLIGVCALALSIGAAATSSITH